MKKGAMLPQASPFPKNWTHPNPRWLTRSLTAEYEERCVCTHVHRLYTHHRDAQRCALFFKGPSEFCWVGQKAHLGFSVTAYGKKLNEHFSQPSIFTLSQSSAWHTRLRKCRHVGSFEASEQPGGGSGQSELLAKGLGP